MLEQFKTQYQKDYANDEDELERCGLFKKSKASVVQRDDMKRLRSEDDEKHQEHIDHDSKHDNCWHSWTVLIPSYAMSV